MAALTRLDATGVLCQRQREQVPAGSGAEERAKSTLSECRDVAHRLDAGVVELGLGDGSDAPQPADRQRMQEGQLGARCDDQQSVGFADRTRDLGQELAACAAHRDRETDLVADAAADRRGDVLRGPADASEPADTEERLVDADALHDRRRVVEDVEDLAAGLHVGVEPRPDHDGVRAEPARLVAGHRRAHSPRLGLVAGGQHHASPDQDGASSQGGIVPLLDRGVERVEVGVQDRGLLPLAPLDPHRTYVRIPIGHVARGIAP